MRSAVTRNSSQRLSHPAKYRLCLVHEVGAEKVNFQRQVSWSVSFKVARPDFVFKLSVHLVPLGINDEIKE